MAEPRDRHLFSLTSALVTVGLAFIERRISAKRRIKPYENWPELSWSDGMPVFTLASIDPPIDYKDAFDPIWSLFRWTAADAETEFDFDEQQAYGELKQYILSELHLASRLFPPDVDEGMFSHSLKSFLKHAIDRYIHIIGGTSFDSEKFLEIYIPLEAGLLMEELPIEIQTPILLVSFSLDSYTLDETISIAKMPEPLQLARAHRDHDTHDVKEYLLQQASHSLVFRNHILPNSDYRQRFWGYDVSPSTREIIDTFFACLRIITSIETGYAQVLFVPVGWAHSYTAGLPPLEGITTRKYPPNLHPVSTLLEEEFPKISDQQVDGVRKLFTAIAAIQDTSEGSRLRLAIKRLNSCYMREDQEDAILDATIGLELLLSDNDTQEVTHKLALRLAALSKLVPGYELETTTIFRNVKSSIYPFRSAIVHGDEKKASKKREIKTERGETVSAVRLAIEYLGMVVRAVAAYPEYLDPAVIDERLLLGIPRYDS